MNRLEKIREEFKIRFSSIVLENKLIMLPDGHCQLFPEDTFIVNWYSEDLQKQLLLEEADKNSFFKFAYALRKIGENYDWDDIYISCINVNKQVEDIFYFYKLWFIDNLSPQEMDIVLRKHFRNKNRFLFIKKIKMKFNGFFHKS